MTKTSLIFAVVTFFAGTAFAQAPIPVAGRVVRGLQWLLLAPRQEVSWPKPPRLTRQAEQALARLSTMSAL